MPGRRGCWPRSSPRARCGSCAGARGVRGPSSVLAICLRTQSRRSSLPAERLVDVGGQAHQADLVAMDIGEQRDALEGAGDRLAFLALLPKRAHGGHHARLKASVVRRWRVRDPVAACWTSWTAWRPSSLSAGLRLPKGRDVLLQESDGLDAGPSPRRRARPNRRGRGDGGRRRRWLRCAAGRGHRHLGAIGEWRRRLESSRIGSTCVQ